MANKKEIVEEVTEEVKDDTKSEERYGFDENKRIVRLEDKGDPKPRATKYRVGAVLLWIAAIFFEVLGILRLVGKLSWFPNMNTLTFVILALVLDLACFIPATLLWKKSNRIDPASEKDPVKFWLHNNLGLILSILAFLPIIIFILSNKDLDKKDKTILATIAIIFLAIAGLTGYEWHPYSAEQLAQAEKEAQAVAIDTDANGNALVYWAPVAGKKYHVNKDCPALKIANEVKAGTVKQAFEAKLTDPCRRCIPELHDEDDGHDHDHTNEISE